MIYSVRSHGLSIKRKSSTFDGDGLQMVPEYGVAVETGTGFVLLLVPVSNRCSVEVVSYHRIFPVCSLITLVASFLKRSQLIDQSFVSVMPSHRWRRQARMGRQFISMS